MTRFITEPISAEESETPHPGRHGDETRLLTAASPASAPVRGSPNRLTVGSHDLARSHPCPPSAHVSTHTPAPIPSCCAPRSASHFRTVEQPET